MTNITDQASSKFDRSPVHLCFITDEAYVLPTATAIESLKVNKAAETKYVVHVIFRSVSPVGVERIRGVGTNDVSIHAIENAVLPVDESKISLVRHVSTSAIFKFFIPLLLPELSRVIYLDSDILIQDDFAEMWQTDVSRVYAGVVKDSQSVVGWNGHLKWLQFRHGAYFNSGVMLLNLDLMRRDGIPDRLLDYRIRGRNRFMDQDALNVVFGERVRYLPVRCNCLNWLFHACTIDQLKSLFGPDEVADTPEENFENALVLHIGGSEKPWLCDLPYYTKRYRRYSDAIGWHFEYPKVSVVVPVFNSQKYLQECIQSILGQTLQNLEVVCVDNGSTDRSWEMIEAFAVEDPRIRIFKTSKKGAGVCRNLGVSRARGTFVGFVDSDDFVAPSYFEDLYKRAIADDCEVCMTSSVRECDANGIPGKWKNMGAEGRKLVETAKERGDLVLASGATWNKIYSRRFLLDNAIRFSEFPCAGEDKVFDYGVLLNAKRIAVVDGPTYYYRQSGSNSESFRRKGRESFAIVDFYLEIRNMIENSTAPSCEKAYWRSVAKRGRDAEFRTFFNRMDPAVRNDFEALYMESFYIDAASTMRIDGLIVSLTSFPSRIKTVHRTIKSILGQSIRPEKTVLWLAKEQFPEGEGSLPAELLELVPCGLEICWCKDIRSYKKLIPALKRFPDKCIVTADDDVIYSRYWLEKLWQEHLSHPNDIIAHRLRKMLRSEGDFVPYDKWPLVSKTIPVEPFLALQTGVGGVLYPPKCFTEDIFNESVFMAVAPQADDLWFWAMAFLARRQVRQVYSYEGRLNLLGGTQQFSLSRENVENGKNDVQLRAILDRYPEINKYFNVVDERVRREKIRKAIAEVPSAIINSIRKLVKQFVPYGLMLHWLERKYSMKIDEDLLHYPGIFKRTRRLLKFCLPFGLVCLFRKIRYGDTL